MASVEKNFIPPVQSMVENCRRKPGVDAPKSPHPGEQALFSSRPAKGIPKIIDKINLLVVNTSCFYT
jgi:hypothetical protein